VAEESQEEESSFEEYKTKHQQMSEDPEVINEQHIEQSY
jgi:hypothetical protein|tara:strand:+ start:2609 stop:2725 length:117 start_codon:yes stop_codon:yes gene_type:complete